MTAAGLRSVAMAGSSTRERLGGGEPTAPPTEELQISKSMVDRAGRALADRWTGVLDLRNPDDRGMASIVDLWRQAHAEPMAWVSAEVAKRAAEESPSHATADRLKRMPQIVKKLARIDKMKLARMQDVGGCRVIVPTLNDVDRVERRIVSPRKPSWPLRYRHDHREGGKPGTGYRALHLIVERQGCLVEIQLRTLRQHRWAEAVERATALSDHNVKEGDAPDEIMEYFRLASDGLWLLDRGKDVPEDHRTRCRELHRRVRAYLAVGEA
jgi:ppGpp synthetase/RelA/SpoT-type nucleotidyltranferase